MRAELRRRAEQHHVDAAVDQLLVGVEADEPVLGRRRRPSTPTFSSCLQVARLLLEPVLEGVGHGDELDVRVGGERLGGRAGAAAAAADQADPQHVAAGRVDGRAAPASVAGDGRGLEELAAGR